MLKVTWIVVATLCYLKWRRINLKNGDALNSTKCVRESKAFGKAEKFWDRKILSDKKCVFLISKSFLGKDSVVQFLLGNAMLKRNTLIGLCKSQVYIFNQSECFICLWRLVQVCPRLWNLTCYVRTLKSNNNPCWSSLPRMVCARW